MRENIAHAGVRVLHVINRIFVGLFFCQIDIEIHRRIQLPHQKKIARRIDADLFDQLQHRNDVARAFGHFDDFAAAQQIHLLNDVHLKAAGRIAEREHGRFHAFDVAVMIRAPQIIKLVEAAAIFVHVIRNIAEKIRRRAVTFDQHAILLVAELGRAKPRCAVFLIAQLFFSQ